MYRRQRGVTFIGWLFLLVPIAIVAYGGIRLAPIYLNYLRVAHALDLVASEVKGEDAGALQSAIHTSLSRHFEVDSIEYPTIKDIAVHRDGPAWVLEANYEEVAPLFGNLKLLVEFDKIARIG